MLQALASDSAERRSVHTIEGVDQRDRKLWVGWTLFHCPSVDQTFVASVTSPGQAPVAHAQERLRTLACPAALTAAEALTEGGSGP